MKRVVSFTAKRNPSKPEEILMAWKLEGEWTNVLGTLLEASTDGGKTWEKWLVSAPNENAIHNEPLPVRLRAWVDAKEGPAEVEVPVPNIGGAGLQLRAVPGGIEVTSAPEPVDFAFCKVKEGTPEELNVQYGPKGLKQGDVAHPPDSSHLWGDAHLTNQKEWYSAQHGRVQTTFEPTKPTEEPKEEPKKPPLSTTEYLALHAGNWQPHASQDISEMSVPMVRIPSGRLAAEAPLYAAKGIRVIGIFGEGGSIASIASRAAAYAKEVREAVEKYKLFAAEILNEPGGSWFWSDPNNIEAYHTIAKAVREEFVTHSITAERMISFDGGKGGNEGVAWGEKLAKTGIFELATMATCHPYGGASGGNGGALGDRHKVKACISVLGIPVFCTETGWPTGTGSTGDSQSWTLSQQAANYASWIAFQYEESKLVGTAFYGYKNSGDTGADQYGVEMHNSNTRKPSFTTLAEACRKLAAGQLLNLADLEIVDEDMAVHLSDLVADYMEEPQPGTEEHTWERGQKLTPMQQVELAEQSV